MMSLDFCTYAESWNSGPNDKESLFIITIIDMSQVLILKEVDDTIVVSRNKTVHLGNETNIKFIILKA